jgi:hypothetical protein
VDQLCEVQLNVKCLPKMSKLATQTSIIDSAGWA